MKIFDVYSELKRLNLLSFQTKDVATLFNISTNHANKILSRIAENKELIHLKHATWVFPDVEPLLIPFLLVAPFPAYISLQTALYYHGMVSQIPSVIYAVSLARTRLYKNNIATVSIHHIQQDFFFGYQEMEENRLIKIASPEKALLDIFYLSPAKSRLFYSLPEIELTKKFKISVAKEMINKIRSQTRRSVVKSRFSEFMERLR